MTHKQNQINIILNILKNEYMKRAQLIFNTTRHIDFLCSEHIISQNENSRYMKMLNDITKFLNIIYNNIIKESNNDDIDDDCHDNTNIKTNINTNTIYDRLTSDINIQNNISFIENINKKFHDIYLTNSISLINIFDDKMIFFEEFNELDEMLKKIMIIIGCSDMENLLYIYTKIPLKNLFSSETHLNLIEILQKTFVPLYINLDKKQNSESMVSISKCNKIPLKYEILLGNFYVVNIYIPNISNPIYLNIYGFFKIDCLNIISRTSQICCKLINKKKKDFYNSLINKKKSIPTEFKQFHIKNLNIGEILANDEKTYGSLLMNDYALIKNYSNSSFKQLFEEFIQSSIEGKFKIIKILLLSHQFSNPQNIENNHTQYANNAGLLFGLVKESKIGTSIIADVIFKNLNLYAKNKLSKSNSSIKFDLDKLNNIDADDIDLNDQLAMNKNIPDKIKKLIKMKLSEMKSGNSEYYKQLTYVKTLIDFPWVSKHDIDIFTTYSHDNDKKKEIIHEIKERINNRVYGHYECKESILELVGKWFSNPKSLGKAIGLLGPPGVGKTLLARELGYALDIPFAQINLGGVEDGSILSGHSITYSGAVPGLIVKKIVEAGKSRCILFFDELDKTSYHHGRNEIFDILMHVIDTTQNTEFTDKFFQEIKFPIDKILFIFSFNDKNKVDRILLDRMEIIKVDAYSTEDKIKIINNFIIKDMKNEFGFNDYIININDEDSEYIIETYTSEAGVRGIKRKIEKLFSRMNMDRLMERGVFETQTKEIILDRDLIDKYIKKPKITNKKINSQPKIGNVNGLYATTTGMGGIIPILIYKNHNNNGRFKLELTGKQGDVMKESVKFAFTIAINLVKSKFRKEFKKKFRGGLHIHTPDGATAKDGPSAGAAFTLAFISVILGKKIKNDIGLTGEIEQDGNITAIGGLEHKLPGAKKAGIRLAFVPKENEKDLEKLRENNKNLFDHSFDCILVDHISEILDLALIDDENYISENINKKLFNHNNYISLFNISPLSKKSNNNSISTNTFHYDTNIDNSDTTENTIQNTHSDSSKNTSCSSSYDKR
jgi:endopeptidase La